MDESLELWETPEQEGCYLVAGWQQWADAGATSSHLPRYLIEQTHASRIGRIRSDGFYLFQVPGLHQMMRPNVKLVNGYREQISEHRNELYRAVLGDKHLYIFCGEEPQLAEERYASAFFEMVQALKVKRVVAVGGVYGPVPYQKEREVSCVYSLPAMRPGLQELALTLSNYEGAATLCTWLAHKAEARDIEYVALYAFVPAYDLPALAPDYMRIEQDYRAWHGVLRRVAHMAGVSIDLADLEHRSRDLTDKWNAEIDTIAREHPEAHIRAYLQAISAAFEERPFMPLDAAWDELNDLLTGMDN